jgi:hypothetical protein
MPTKRSQGDRRRTPTACRWQEAESLEDELGRIARLSLDELRTCWRTRFSDRPPDTLSRDMLVRLMAWRIQAERFGGLDAGTRKLLARMADGQREPPRRLRIGSVLVREYGGALHEVTVAAGGYQWCGSIHASLSGVARAITGTAWNGPRFFGLRDIDSVRNSGPDEHPEGPPAGRQRADRSVRSVNVHAGQKSAVGRPTNTVRAIAEKR